MTLSLPTVKTIRSRSVADGRYGDQAIEPGDRNVEGEPVAANEVQYAIASCESRTSD